MKVYILEYKPLPDRRSDHERQSSLAEKLLRFALRRDFRVDMDALIILKGPQGKPYFKDSSLHFNKSHSEGMVAVAIGDSEVGADCQLIKPVSEALINRTCSEGEKAAILSSPEPDKAFALTWAKKEALVKLTGTGLTVPIREIDSEKVTSFLMTDHHALAAVSENGEEAEFIFITEEDMGE